MDASEALSTTTGSDSPRERRACPRCGEPPPRVRPVETALFEGSPLSRCPRCGSRHTSEEAAPGRLLDCSRCGLPFLAADGAEGGETHCPDCHLGRVPADLPDAMLAAATEREVQLALEPRWRFLTSRSSTIYLNKVLRQVARGVRGAPERARAILVEDPALRTLALPSGTILISQGTLDELEDEAQLAFLLAHELAHATSGEAAARLVRFGFQAVAHEGETRDETGWADAAEDVVRLGYGERREREADAIALRAVLDQGYEPRSVLDYLRRLDDLVEQGDDRVADLALSHPPARERSRRVERALFERVETGGPRQVNREVFRRAARDHAETSESASLRALAAESRDGEEPSFLDRWISRLPWIGIVAFLALLLALVLGVVF
jgi:hypothetical protein